jgi:REP element-mobilizing transposase RayT
MSTRSYSEINLHFVWHVKANLPIINAEIEPRLYSYIRNYALQSKDLIFHEIGGTETHVHIGYDSAHTSNQRMDWEGQRREFSLRQSRTREPKSIGLANRIWPR